MFPGKLGPAQNMVFLGRRMAVVRSVPIKHSLGARLGPVLWPFGQVIPFDTSWWLFSILS